MINSSQSDSLERLADLLDYFFKGLCVIGFVTQLTYVLIRFFDYEHLTFVIFSVPEETTLPDVFFCSDFLTFINFTLLFQKYPKLISILGLPRNPFNNPRKTIKDQLLTRFTTENVSQLIARYLTISQVTECLLPMDQIFGTLDIRTQLNQNINDLCELKLFYRRYMLCFVFVCSKDHPIVASTHDYYKQPVDVELWLLRLRQSYFRSVDYLFIGASEPKNLPVSPSSKMDVQTMTDYPRAFRYHLKTVELRLLPPPYETSCRDYSRLQSNYTSRDAVIDSCLTQKSIASTGCPHPLSLQSSNLNLPFATECYDRNSGNITFRRLINSIVDDCIRANSQPDCIHQTYFIQGRAPVTIYGNFSTLVMDEIKEPAIVIIYEPMQTWLYVIVQIGSCLGTWFGFSILVHIPKITRFIVYRVNSFLHCSRCSQQPNRLKSKRKPENISKLSYYQSLRKPFNGIASPIDLQPISYEPPKISNTSILTHKRRPNRSHSLRVKISSNHSK
ncbi:uncharacterized protein LOC128390967 [Panonychus citri]|uniref:uncharacterized protein LOC128390967 n=1 Tax=Panonychus citri TaxID=50023 RepID=UPI0023081242|nr:uncharacterized protein LOC128390967 [Panonychus citri]